MNVTTFFVIRHGQTEWNSANRLMGVSDIPLNTEGKKQAIAAADYLKTIPLDIIVTSPLQRAVETARIIRKHHPEVPLKKLDKLHERNFGSLEGKKYEEANNLYPQIILGHMWQYPDFRPPDGESLSDVSQRAKHVITHLLRHYEGQKIGVISHGSFIRNFFSVLLDIPLEHINDYGFANTSLSIASYSAIHGAEAHIMNSISP